MKIPQATVLMPSNNNTFAELSLLASHFITKSDPI